MQHEKKKGSSKLDEKPKIVKGPVDLQRLRLEKLMKNPDKPIIIPERPKSKNMPSAPDFVRNVMGSSAGAGSGEFHVYRHLRRKEYARQKFIQEKSEKEILDDEYHNKLEQNRMMAEEKTAKKREKRLKKKQKAKQKGKKPKIECKKESESEEEDSSEGEEEDDIKQVKHKTEEGDSKKQVKNETNDCSENKNGGSTVENKDELSKTNETTVDNNT